MKHKIANKNGLFTISKITAIATMDILATMASYFFGL